MSAWIAYKAKTHWLVQYRASRKDPKRSWSCPPDQAVFDRFKTFIDACQDAGIAIPDPLPQEFLALSPRNTKPHRRRSAPAPVPAATPPKASVGSMTLEQWIGRPSAGKPGPFFSWSISQQKGPRQAAAYEALVHSYASTIASKPMASVTHLDADLILAMMLVCPACKRRAEKAANTAILGNPSAMSVVNDPWDGADKCTETENSKIKSTHYPRLQRESIKTYLGLLKAAFKAALDEAGRDNPDLAGLVRNPFGSLRLPKFSEPTDNNDRIQALSVVELQAIARRMPENLEAAVFVGAFGMQRRSELMGLSRRSIIWPDANSTDQLARIRIHSVRLINSGGGTYTRTYGKTNDSTGTEVTIGELATAALRKHVNTFLSTPRPDQCEACRDGHGEWLEPDTPNPHIGCDFDDDTLLWRTTDGEPVHPNEMSRIFAEAAIAAGLTRKKKGFIVTLKVLRTTGATLLIEAGIELELVLKMGRWTNSETLRRHYNRTRNDSKTRAATALNELARNELGIDAPVNDDAPARAQVAVLTRHNQTLQSQIDDLTKAIIELGGDPSAVGKVDRVNGERCRATKWTDDDLRTAVETCRTRKHIIEKLGVAPAKKNYDRIETRARKLGLTLPTKWKRGSE